MTIEHHLAPYEATRIDWAELRELAVRAARETPIPPAPGLGYLKTPGWQPSTAPRKDTLVDVCGPHWLLDYAFNRYESPGDDPKEEEYAQYLYVLMPDGELRTVTFAEETAAKLGSSEWWLRSKTDHQVSPMSDRDIEDVDFERRTSQQGVNYGDSLRSPDSALLQDRRGDGLRRLLEDIRTGRARQRATVSPPFDCDVDTRYSLPALTDFHLTPDRRAEKLEVVRQQQNTRDESSAAKAKAAEMEKLSRLCSRVRGLLAWLGIPASVFLGFSSLVAALADKQALGYVRLFFGLAIMFGIGYIVLAFVERSAWKSYHILLGHSRRT